MSKILRYILLAGLFLTPLIPLVVFNSFFFPYITSKAFTFRILAEALFAIWLILILINPHHRPRRSLVLYSVVGLVAILSLATIFGVSPYQSFWSNFERMDGLINYLHLFIYFLVTSSVLKTERIWKIFFNSSLGVSVIVATHALLQLAGKLPITQSGARVEATFGNASYLAVYMLLHIFLAGWLWYASRRRKWTSLFYGPVIVSALITLYYTATRGAILGLVGGVLFSAIIIAVRGKAHPLARKIAVGVLACVFIALAGFFLVKDSSFVRTSPVLSRLASISLKDFSTDTRYTIWRMAFRGFGERPILGWGPENFLAVFDKHYEPSLWDQEPWFDRSHNIFIDWLVHAGAFGLAVYLSLFAAALYYIRRYEDDIVTKAIFIGLLAAYSIHNFFVFDNLISLLLFFSLLAYFHRLKVNQEEVSGAGEGVFGDRPLNVARISITVAVALALLASVYWVNIKPARVSRNIISAFGNPSVTERLDFFNKALAAETFGTREAVEQLIRSTYSISDSQTISPETKLKYLELSVSEADKLLKRFPRYVRLRILVGVLYNHVGQPENAIRYLEEARALSPKKQLILTELAQSYLIAGDTVEALSLAEETFLLSPDYKEARIIYSMMLILGERLVDAEELWPESSLPSDSRIINAYVKIGRYDKVLELWQQRVVEEPGVVQHRFSLAAAYLQMGSRLQAIAELEEAVKIDPRVQSQVEYLTKEIRAGRNPVSE